jgi:hypothetical protein
MGTPFWQQILLKKRGKKIGIMRFSNSPARNPSEAFNSMLDLPTVKGEEPQKTGRESASLPVGSFWESLTQSPSSSLR